MKKKYTAAYAYRNSNDPTLIFWYMSKGYVLVPSRLLPDIVTNSELRNKSTGSELHEGII